MFEDSREVLSNRADYIGFRMPVTNYQFQFTDGHREQGGAVMMTSALGGDTTLFENAVSTHHYDVCAVPVLNYGGVFDWFCDITKSKYLLFIFTDIY